MTENLNHSISRGVPDRPPVQNPAQVFLVIGGILLFLVGTLIGFTNGNRVSLDASTDSFIQSLGVAPDGKMAADTAWMWAGIIIAIVGALMLLARVIIAAARR